MSEPIGYGIDVSAFQSESVIDACAGDVDFVICRAAYGSAVDKRVVTHAARVRAIGAKCGLYLFFRPSQPVQSQLDAFRAAASAIGYGSGDIVPALDIERDPYPVPGVDVSPAWARRVEQLLAGFDTLFGGSMVYITQREFDLLGQPDWILARPLWVAHYTAASRPASPGGIEPTIWQHRVSTFLRDGPGGYNAKQPLVDQNRLLRPLPLIPGSAPVITEEESQRLAGLISLTAQESAEEAFRGSRRAGEHDDDATRVT